MTTYIHQEQPAHQITYSQTKTHSQTEESFMGLIKLGKTRVKGEGGWGGMDGGSLEAWRRT